MTVVSRFTCRSSIVKHASPLLTNPLPHLKASVKPIKLCLKSPLLALQHCNKPHQHVYLSQYVSYCCDRFCRNVQYPCDRHVTGVTYRACARATSGSKDYLLISGEWVSKEWWTIFKLVGQEFMFPIKGLNVQTSNKSECKWTVSRVWFTHFWNYSHCRDSG